jgi:hypothetical protein
MFCGCSANLRTWRRSSRAELPAENSDDGYCCVLKLFFVLGKVVGFAKVRTSLGNAEEELLRRAAGRLCRLGQRPVRVSTTQTCTNQCRPLSSFCLRKLPFCLLVQLMFTVRAAVCVIVSSERLKRYELATSYTSVL